MTKKASKPRNNANGQRAMKPAQPPEQITCLYCGQKHPKNKLKCPAWGKSCRKCGTKNHFAKMCMQKKTNALYMQEMDVEKINHVCVQSSCPSSSLHAELLVNEKLVKFQILTQVRPPASYVEYLLASTR